MNKRKPLLDVEGEVRELAAADVLAAPKATGKGCQTRVNDAMREWVKRHPQG